MWKPEKLYKTFLKIGRGKLHSSKSFTGIRYWQRYSLGRWKNWSTSWHSSMRIRRIPLSWQMWVFNKLHIFSIKKKYSYISHFREPLFAFHTNRIPPTDKPDHKFSLEPFKNSWTNMIAKLAYEDKLFALFSLPRLRHTEHRPERGRRLCRRFIGDILQVSLSNYTQSYLRIS